MNERASEEPDSDILKQIKELMGEGAPVAGGSKANPASQAEVSPGAAIRDELIKILEAARPTDPIPNSAIVDETIKPPVEMPVTEAGASGPTSDAISGSAQTRQWRSWRAHPLFNFIGPIVLVFIGAAIVVVGLGGALFEIWGTRAPSVSISTTRNAAPVPDDIAPQRTAEAETSSPAYSPALRTPTRFDCINGKHMGTDYVICASPQLLDAEARLEAAYSAARAGANGDRVKSEQLDWMKRFGPDCGLPLRGPPSDEKIQNAAGCVGDAVEQRIKELEAER